MQNRLDRRFYIMYLIGRCGYPAERALPMAEPHFGILHRRRLCPCPAGPGAGGREGRPYGTGALPVVRAQLVERFPILISPASSCSRIPRSVSMSSLLSTRDFWKERLSLNGPPFGP